MTLLFSLLPILLVILALLAKVRSLMAALIGLLAAVIVMLIAFPQPPILVASAFLGWLPVLAEVLLIIGGGLLLSELLARAGAQADIARWIAARTGAGTGAILLIVHGVTPFAEALTGFGIGITIGIPLLVQLGLSHGKAAGIGLLGLCAVPWGSMAPGTLIAANMAGISFHDLGLASAAFSIIPFMVTGMAAAWIFRPGFPSLVQGAVSGVFLAAAVVAANALFGTAPAGAVGSLIVIVARLLLSRPSREPLSPLGHQGLVAYGILLGGVLIFGAIASLAGGQTAIRYLGSPALWLFLAAFWFARGAPPAPVGKAAWASWLGVAPVTAVFILLGIVMAVSGMATLLAQGLAGTGRAYLLLSPFVAGAGGFITGSNSGANAMLAATQADIARELGVDVLWFMAAHNVAASFLLMASPAKVEMAVRLAGAPEYQRFVQKLTLLVAAIVLAGLGVVSAVGAAVA